MITSKLFLHYINEGRLVCQGQNRTLHQPVKTRSSLRGVGPIGRRQGQDSLLVDCMGHSVYGISRRRATVLADTGAWGV